MLRLPTVIHLPILYGKVDVNAMSNEELVERIRNGYHVTENMQVLYENNLPLIKKFIKPYAYYESEEDLLQEAYFGLWEAVRHYESSENVLFMTYARYWIKQSIQRYMENSGSILRISSAYRQKIARYNKTVQEFEQTYGHTPTDEEMADYSLPPLSEIQKIKTYMQEIVSLDAPIKADEELSLADTWKMIWLIKYSMNISRANYGALWSVIQTISRSRLSESIIKKARRYQKSPESPALVWRE